MRLRLALATILSIAISHFTSGCGVKGDPLPPEESLVGALAPSAPPSPTPSPSASASANR